MRYENELKEEIVKLYNEGKSANKIMEEYQISSSTLYRWIKNYNNTGSFKAKNNRTPYENDILKRAALIMARKSK